MSVKYLFDTSAVRSISKKTIESLYKERRKLYISPYSFWEILTHLEEDFRRWKKELLKFGFFNILDDPYAYLDKIFLPSAHNLRNRSQDNNIICQMIAILQNSNSFDDFYTTDIIDSKGHYREMKGCVTRAQDSLLKTEKKYVGFVGEIIEGLRKGKVEIPNCIEDYHERVMELIEGRILQYRQRGALVKNLQKKKIKMINRFYFFFSYILLRALKYYESNTDIKEIDKNDYEDATICLHLGLQTSFCLVTKDNRMREALTKTISLLNKLNNTQFKTSLRIKSLDDLKVN